MTMGDQDIKEALSRVKDPQTGRNILDLGCVREFTVNGSDITIHLSVDTDDPEATGKLRSHVEASLRQVGAEKSIPLGSINIQLEGHQSGEQETAESTPSDQAQRLPGVGHVVAVGAGKGGVGKTTVALNLAVALGREGHRVGLLDGDIYGPSIPTMLGLEDMQTEVHDKTFIPFQTAGIKAMSIGKLVEPDKALVWRGPMAHGAFRQLLFQTEWGELDYLVVDLPPGTGDVPLSLMQMVALSGAVIVCTPQKVAQDDAVRAAMMFSQLGVDVLGVVENMSYMLGEDGSKHDLFGMGGAQVMAETRGLPFLGAIPLTSAMRQAADDGRPMDNFESDAPTTAATRSALESMARSIKGRIDVSSISTGPQLKVH
ncbi:MAG: sodium:proton antiporter [Phycisphaerae bacterium]|nr:sodium:proton antiporter [Phycisphaerae bacterium]